MNTKALLFICFLYCLVCFTYVEANLSEKTEELRRQALRSPTGVIEVSAEQYNKYVLESPRPYDVVVFYTAQSCNFCDKIYAEYKLASSFYRDSGALYSQKINDQKKRAVFFLVISYSEQAHDIFKNMNFVSIPNIAVLSPKIAHMSPAEQMMHVKSLSWQISYTDGHVTSHKLLEFINKRTTRNVEYKESVFNILLVLSVFTAIGFVLYFLFIKFRFIFINNKLWLVGSLIIYVICMSGFIYNILHDIPLTMTDKKGNLQWMTTHEGRSQLGAEGLIMSISISFAGMLIFAASKIFKKMEIDMLSRAIFVILLIASFFLIQFVEDIYASKSHYKIRFWPPSTYVRGPLINDQGNSI